MTSDEFAACVHPREYARLILALLFAAPVTLLLLGVIYFTSGLALAAVLFVALLVWFGFEISYATLLGHWILVSEYNYPRLKHLLDEVKREIGVKTRVDMIVFEQGQFNTLLSTLFARRAIYIYSELLEQGVSDDELRWIIGRFIGHIRAKRRLGALSWMISAAEYLGVFNLFLYPYVRATVYTGDRAGLAAINGNISTAVSAMNKLMVGRQLGYSVNPEGIVRQSRRVQGSFFGFLGRLASPLPYTVARYVDLIRFSEHRFPNQYTEFATLNPAFQMAGGTNKLLHSGETFSEEERKSIAGKVGWLLAGGLAASLVLSGVWVAMLGFPFAPKHAMGDIIVENNTPESAPPYIPPPPPPPPPAPAAPEYYGSFAVSDSTGVYAHSTMNATQADADEAALQSCRSHNLAPTDCRVVGQFVGECAVIAYPQNSGSDSPWFVGYGASEDEARQDAANRCANSGYTCQVAEPACSK
jgi:hypothetical protein